MEHKRVYEVPESELLELKLDKDFLDYTSQKQGVEVEKPYIITPTENDGWDS